MSRGGVQKGEGDGEWAGRGGDYKGGELLLSEIQNIQMGGRPTQLGVCRSLWRRGDPT